MKKINQKALFVLMLVLLMAVSWGQRNISVLYRHLDSRHQPHRGRGRRRGSHALRAVPDPGGHGHADVEAGQPATAGSHRASAVKVIPEGIHADLLFSGRLHHCWIPYESIWAVYNPETGEGAVMYKGRSGIIERIDGGTFPAPPGGVWVHYTAGYAAEDMPGLLRDINARLAAAYCLAQIEGDRNPEGLASIGEGALSVSYGGHSQKAAALMEGWKEALIPLKRLSYGSI